MGREEKPLCSALLRKTYPSEENRDAIWVEEDSADKGWFTHLSEKKHPIKTRIKFDIPNEMVTEKELVLLESMESMLITNLWAVRCVYLCLYRWVGCHFNPVMGLTRVP